VNPQIIDLCGGDTPDYDCEGDTPDYDYSDAENTPYAGREQAEVEPPRRQSVSPEPSVIKASPYFECRGGVPIQSQVRSSGGSFASLVPMTASTKKSPKRKTPTYEKEPTQSKKRAVPKFQAVETDIQNIPTSSAKLVTAFPQPKKKSVPKLQAVKTHSKNIPTGSAQLVTAFPREAVVHQGDWTGASHKVPRCPPGHTLLESSTHEDFKYMIDTKKCSAVLLSVLSDGKSLLSTDNSTKIADQVKRKQLGGKPIEAVVVGMSVIFVEIRTDCSLGILHKYYIPVVKHETRSHVPDCVWSAFEHLLSSHKVEKYMFNAQFQLRELLKAGSEEGAFKTLFPLRGRVNKIYDPMVAAYCMHSELESYAFSFLLQTYGAVSNADGIEPPKVAGLDNSLENDARSLYQLMQVLCAKLSKQNLRSAFMSVEMKMVPLLAEMEFGGIPANKKYLESLGPPISQVLSQLEGLVRTLVKGKIPHDFNIQSPHQVSELLFNTLKLIPPKKNTSSKKAKTDHASCNKEVLESMQSQHPVIKPIMQYRDLMKTEGTFVGGLAKHIKSHAIFGLTITPNWNHMGTATGRLSSSEPNMQNVTNDRESEFGLNLNVRNFLEARPDTVLVGADYSNLELRVLAHMSGDMSMTQLFSRGRTVDVIRLISSRCYSKSIEDVTNEERKKTKSALYGVIYGSGADVLARQLGISREEAKDQQQMIRNKFRGIQVLTDRVVKSATAQGFVLTIKGRRRIIKNLQSTFAPTREMGKRQAFNAAIQGSAADIIKVASIKMSEKMSELSDKGGECFSMVRLLAQIHDELLYEVPASLVKEFVPLLQNEMECAADMSVPLFVKVQTGNRWGDMKMCGA